MRSFLALSASLACLSFSSMADAQSRNAPRSGPSPAPAFWVHDDGTVEVNNADGRTQFREHRGVPRVGSLRVGREVVAGFRLENDRRRADR